jgi:bacterial/archaeal transporter family-2 protein
VKNLYMVLAAAAGAGLAVQAAVNTQLRVATGSALWAAIVTAALAAVMLVTVELFVRDPLRMDGLSAYPWWIWTGGIMGGAYVFAIVALTRHLGVAVVFAAIVVGQLLAGLFIDHYGWFRVPAEPLSITRLVGALLLVAGMVLIRWR